ncbi:UvrD-helicase domain-containing protein [Parabacteroides sp. PF5-9]|uniref:ATP-dependent helicase n=1 Tax=Parabacteroides sp. PF5-9 TaxID=1742404 RepID=UPI002473CE88|nr:UvrD-helicase domain-containing protein [Parabacteroides sp. PF5-9]MDH6356486.1 DNA helicase-2/ATP-dependent DNA helicase PcrA [Parabacteroides sp. PF5-9]
MCVENYLDQLNDSQKDAVVYTDGPSLVIAGAGSGKTRVLTYKIAYLLQQGIPPYTILALTFTNKAAREMKERIAAITDQQTARRLWMGTFHSIFSRILRKEAEYIGYPPTFTIYDSADSKSLLKAIIKEMQLDDKVYRVGMIQNRISNAKNSLVTWKAYEQNKELVEYDVKSKVPLLREIYKRYQLRSQQAGAMDFDDLLLQTNILFRDHPAVLEKYREFFQYILVDEYQDTNFAQHLIVQRLSEKHNRICVVGDDAQSIYSFRGANIDNILQFKGKYPNCRVFKLERNYRSTQNIVNAANSLIHKNKEQIKKTVYSEEEEGEKILVLASYSDYEEAYAVTSKIGEMRRAADFDYSDFAILYRTNAQSRILEEALRKSGVPYKIYGGLSFYQRKEIKDVIAYFRLIVNPHDEEALKRVINYPARGIGDTTVGKVIAAASANGISLWNVLNDPLSYALPINSGTAKKLSQFRELIDSFIQQEKTCSADEMATSVIKQSGILAALFQDNSVEGMSKQENVQELLKGIAEYCDIRMEEGEEQVTLADFLSEVALLTDQDNDKDEQANKVTLMTVHAAKGLEFKNVFVVGLEEDLFPSLMSKDSERAIEEERRLFYVAITRAEQNCILSYAKSRFRNGQSNVCSPSRFLRDIDTRFLNMPADLSVADPFASARKEYSNSPFNSPFQQPRMATTETYPTSSSGQKSRLKRLEPEVSGESVVSKSSIGDMPDLQVGSKVHHDRFGDGEVVAIDGEGSNKKATVEFTHLGRKQLLLKYAKLTVLS